MGRSIFISYSRVDHEYVQRLATYISNLGMPVWYDYRLDVGVRFDAEIQNQIESCAAFVVVLSPEGVASDWVGDEIAYARQHKKPILPLMLRTCNPPLPLVRIQREDVTSAQMPSDAFVEQLRAALAETSPVDLVVGTKTRRTVQVADLISGGLLKAGAVLVNRKGDHRAVVRDDGQLEIDGTPYPTPSAAGTALLGRTVNGWTYWLTEDEHKSLDSLRAELISKQ